ncbi:flotillin-2-like [Homalodisca vitripennis]|uniref:flotillin-2-like n=1 Tax=Homalodisca vitripennis TaxID=197043 RepID=UPI001EEB919A|nr:flotillin-2-like [Homalodisca vitripennis]KAG8288129.1 Flotillin-2 [Homalodisca vitripennis]KAG8299456.1 Flotillin-2 [Homalodisca vitripennis]
MGNHLTCGPDEVIVISGGLVRGKKKRYIIGGYAYAIWCITDVQYLSLNLMTVYPYCHHVETILGVAVTVSSVAQCKFLKDMEFLKIATEQFLGMEEDQIKRTICETLEGTLRAIVGGMTVEQLYKDRVMFSKRVWQVAAPDMARMGMAIMSFTIRDIWDEENYLRSLGRAQIAAVKRDAAIGVAEAERDAGIREAECEKEAQNVIFEMRAKIGSHSKMYNLAKSSFDQEVNAAKAQAALAYELQAAKIQQQIRSEEVQIDIIERKKETEVQEKEVERKNKELISTIRLPAEAESYEIYTVAQGLKAQTLEEGKAEAEQLRLLGTSDARVLQVTGNADAHQMLLRANVFKSYQTAAKLALVLESLPKITTQICLPLEKVKEIVIIGGSDNITSELSRLIGQIPPSLSALAGKELENLLKKK